MNCRYLENRLESLVEGVLPPAQRRACEAHLAACPACRELFELAGLEAPAAVAADDTWVDEVLARTSRSPCAEARAAMCARIDGELTVARRGLVDDHLSACGECAALAGALRALARELPAMARLSPDVRFVDDVLARTLPPAVRLRRFWQRSWTRWLHRPRFASEAAYVGLLVLVLIFATPGSPLEAVPSKALATVQSDPRETLAQPVQAVGQRVETVLDDWREGDAGRSVAGWYATGEQAFERARSTADGLERKIGASWGTLRDEFASLLGKAESPIPEPATPHEERP